MQRRRNLHNPKRRYSDKRQNVGKGIGPLVLFKVGDEVRWVHGVKPSEQKNTVGTISAVMP